MRSASGRGQEPHWYTGCVDHGTFPVLPGVRLGHGEVEEAGGVLAVCQRNVRDVHVS